MWDRQCLSLGNLRNRKEYAKELGIIKLRLGANCLGSYKKKHKVPQERANQQTEVVAKVSMCSI